ncbi:MAG: hypothetical protein WBW81_12220 [Methylocella sp.]
MHLALVLDRRQNNQALHPGTAAGGDRSTAIPFGVNMNESGQIGAGLILEPRYRTID